MLRDPAGDLWLEKRPATGIWGGLWCFPELALDHDPVDWCLDRLGLEPTITERWDRFRHTFSHYHLDIEPLLLQLDRSPETVLAEDRQLWYNVRRPPQIGLAAPVVTLLKRFQ